MNDDTDKLAAQMRNLKPSKKSREAGLDAAMAAFGKEFAADTAQATADDFTDLEKNSTSSQGSADTPRPTGKSTTTVRAKTRRVETMAKIKTAFNFKPQTMMMAGTCSAALIAAMIVIPNMDQLGPSEQQIAVAPVEVSPVLETLRDDLKAQSDVIGTQAAPEPSPESPSLAVEDAIVVTGTRRDEIAQAQTPQNSPKAQSAITSVDDLLNDVQSNSAKAETESRARQQAFSQRADQQSRLMAPEGEAVEEYRAALEKKDNATLSDSQQAITSNAPPPPPQIASSPGFAASGVGQPSAATSAGRTRIILPADPAGRTQIILPDSDRPTSAAPEVTRFGNLTVEQGPPELVTQMQTIVIQPASVEYVKVPPTYETVKEMVVVQEASTELVTTPAEYEWVDGEIEGSTVEYVRTPAEFETVSESVVVQPAAVEYVSLPPAWETVKETILVQPEFVASDGTVVPAVTEEISRRVIKTPASTVERSIPEVTKQVTRRVVKTPSKTIEKIVPFEIKDGKTRVVSKPASVQERVIPAVPKEVTRRVIKTPARTVERTIPAVTKQVEVKVISPQQKYILRDDDGNVVREFENRDAFEKYKSNLTTVVSETPVSTFSVDVDTASYSFLRASVNRGQLPPRDSIRLEEMINYFPYDYEAPKSADTPFKANVTVTPTPWNTDTKLMHIGIKGYVPTQMEKPRSNLVFLIDTSGSMNRANKLPLLINSFKLLLNTLDDDDTVSIVAYASASGTVLEPTSVKNKDEILSALNRLRAGGSTAGAAGLELAYQKAQESFDDEGVNRVILATDGDFNVGFSSPEDMKNFIKEKRETGIFLSVLGFGMGNYNDHLMQSLAQNGNGVAAYIDSLAEANKVLANEAGSALFTIAKDVKIQVEFNPATVAEYRLIGYETRALKRQDFNNDKVDAGEIGAGHTVTAIYEMTPVDSPAITVDKLRYVSDKSETVSTGSDEFAFVKIRHKLPNADKSTLQTFPIGKRQEKSLRRAGDDMRFAAAVAAVGQKLRGDIAVEDYSYEEAIKLAQGAKGKDENGYRAEFIQMVKLIDTMAK